jgi:hypothetical protein
MMNAVTEALKHKSAETADHHFTSQLLLYLQSIPDTKEKELLKVKIINEVIDMKYRT